MAGYGLRKGKGGERRGEERNMKMKMKMTSDCRMHVMELDFPQGQDRFSFSPH